MPEWSETTAQVLKSHGVSEKSGLSASQVARRILRSDGVAGFYRGASVAILRAFAINAAGWPALWAAQRWLGVT